MKLILDLDIDKCCACGACAIACMDQNDIDTACTSPLRSAFVTESNSAEGGKRSYLSIACMHCTDAPCVMACPSGCLKKDEETGLTLYDNEYCISCHSCSMACPLGAPSFGVDGKMEKCDGCYIRLQEGMEPACVQVCALHALSMVSEEAYKKQHLARSLKKITDLIGQ